MGTTRIKVIDLSSDDKEIKTSRKHAEKIATTKITEIKHDNTEVSSPQETADEHPRGEIETSPGQQPGGEKKSKSSSSVVAKNSTHHMGMNYLKSTKSIDKNQNYSLREAVDLLYKTSFVKFDPTVELHINVTDKNVKANVNFPHAVVNKVKEKKYLIFSDKHPRGEVEATPGKHPEGEIIWAEEKTIGEIESGRLKPKRDFDLVIASPKFMPQLARVAKILGPAGMMPNPKNQTITDDPTKVIEASKEVSGTQFTTDPTAPILHTKIGKLSFKPNQLEENMKALIFAIGIAKIQKATLKSTMSPAIKLDLSTINK